MLDGLHDLLCREGGLGMVYWVVAQKPTSYATRCRVLGVGDYCSELFTEGGGYFVFFGDFLLLKVIGWFGECVVSFRSTWQ